MPLDKEHVTAASRRMLPTYPVFFGLIGCGMLFTPLERLRNTPAFRYADNLLGIRLFGCAFIVLALVFIWALIVHKRSAYQRALTVAIVWMGIWAVLTAGSAFADLSSFTAWAWPAFVARACWASLVSLETRET